MNITISGASGLIGRRLMKALTADKDTLCVLSRHAGTNLPGGVRLMAWDPVKGEPPADSLREAGAVVHLAGEPVAQRWNAEVKQKIRDTRVLGTRNLVQAMARLPKAPRTLVCASAIGYYGNRGEEWLRESSSPGTDFLAEVCQAWEQEAIAAESFGARVVRIRIGVVLDARGGALQKMLPPFRMGVGGKLASGQQWMSWIHVQDLVDLIRFALDQPIRGAVNGVAPQPVRNSEFTEALSKALQRPAIIPVPSFALSLMYGEMAGVLLASQRVEPEVAQAAGFKFQFPELPAALKDVLR